MRKTEREREVVLHLPLILDIGRQRAETEVTCSRLGKAWVKELPVRRESEYPEGSLRDALIGAQCACFAVLPPSAVDEHMSIMPVLVSGSDPDGVLARRDFPSSWLPGTSTPVPAVIARNPHMSPAWCRGAMLPDANRRS
jgi:hypothetical protein